MPIVHLDGHRFDPDRYVYLLSTDPAGVVVRRRGLPGLFTLPTVREMTDRRAAMQSCSDIVVDDPNLDLIPFSPLDAAELVVEAATMLHLYPDDTTALLGQEHAEALVLIDITLNRLPRGNAGIRAQMWAVRGAVALLQEGVAVVRGFVGLGLPENPDHDNGLPVITGEVYRSSVLTGMVAVETEHGTLMADEDDFVVPVVDDDQG